tara:strand:- start:1389 stop:1520 length:132 start_codon:yes stop_codon:yes gene_type:complete
MNDTKYYAVPVALNEVCISSFIGLLEGNNFGKLAVRVGPDDLK